MRTENNVRKDKNIWPPLVLGLAALLLALTALGAPRGSSGDALDLSSDGAPGVPAVRNKNGEILLYNFRAVEAGKLYRSSGFPRNRKTIEQGKTVLRPAAFADEQLFNWLRARNIRTIIDLESDDDFYGEEGYFNWWNQRSDYKIQVLHWPVAPDRAFQSSPQSGVRAAVQFLELMKNGNPQGGAVLIHDRTGNESAAVVVATYELWRNAGKAESGVLWQQVQTRYLASNLLIAKDKEIAQLVGDKKSCDDGSKNFVCSSDLEKVRRELEIIAQL